MAYVLHPQDDDSFALGPDLVDPRFRSRFVGVIAGVSLFVVAVLTDFAERYLQDGITVAKCGTETPNAKGFSENALETLEGFCVRRHEST